MLQSAIFGNLWRKTLRIPYGFRATPVIHLLALNWMKSLTLLRIASYKCQRWPRQFGRDTQISLALIVGNVNHEYSGKCTHNLLRTDSAQQFCCSQQGKW